MSGFMNSSLSKLEENKEAEEIELTWNHLSRMSLLNEHRTFIHGTGSFQKPHWVKLQSEQIHRMFWTLQNFKRK